MRRRRAGVRMAGDVSIAEAATILGVSADTVRRRLRSGALVGHREQTPQGYVWRVVLPDAQVPPMQPHRQAPTQGDGDAITRELVAMLRIQLEEKDKQLADRAREVQELHVLLQNSQRLSLPTTAQDAPQAAERPREDESPRDAQRAAPEGVQQAERPLPWWRRLLGLG